jgi:alpha-L-glutamate ligase-like protein
MFSTYGILGMNARNQKYLKTTKRFRRILDSKLATKKALSRAGLPTLETIAVIKSRKELFSFDWGKLPNSFVLKPNRGFGGEGIVVVYARKKIHQKTAFFQKDLMAEKDENMLWIRADRTLISKKELETHVFDILEGNFSLSYLPDIAFFEERAKVIKELKPYSWRGVPDIRVIVYEGVPVMAMLRLPTEESAGRANLHEGAVGVGIDLATGKTLSAIHHGKFIDYYPGTRYLLRGVQIPYFKKILGLAVTAQKVTKTKFLGVDIAVDREKGPLIFELNLRPGLQIQTANLAGLEERLKRIKGLSLKTEERGIKLAQHLFSEEEYEEEEFFGKKVIGVIEEIEIPYIETKGDKEIEKRYKKLAKIDTGALRSSISNEILKKLNIKELEEKRIVRSSLGEEIRPIAPLTFYLKGEKIDTEVFVADRAQMKYEMIIGRRDLKNFIVDPSKVRIGSSTKA